MNMPAIDTARTVPRGGLIDWTLGTDRLADVPASLKRQLADYLDSVYDPAAAWPFRENPDPDATANIETFSWALLILHMLNCTERIRQIRAEVGEALTARFDRFYDPKMKIYLDPQQDSGERGVTGKWRLHNDGIVRGALKMLSLPERPGPQGLESIRDFPWAPQPEQEIGAWLRDCWQASPWAGTKEISQYLRLYQRLTGCDMDERVLEILAFLVSKRDAVTGYVGVPRNGDLGWAMRGHRNNVFRVYLSLGLREPLEWQIRVIESTLSLQREDGLFHDGGGCANLDGVELAVEYYLQTGAYRDRVMAACGKCAAAMFGKLLTPCGGFLWHFPEPGTSFPAGYGRAMVTTGSAFALLTLRVCQAMVPLARENLAQWIEGVCAQTPS